jgi:hypothetical protein
MIDLFSSMDSTMEQIKQAVRECNFDLLPGEHKIQAEPLRSLGTWYGGDVTGEGRGSVCFSYSPVPTFKRNIEHRTRNFEYRRKAALRAIF